jgi:hypothetical protein
MATQVTLNSGSVDSAGSLALKTNGTTTAVTIDTSQNVGIGTASPSGRLAVAATGGAGLIVGQSNDNFYASTNHRFYDLSYTNERMRIDSSGNVGIGTSSPSVSLHVSNATDNVAKIRLSRGTSSQNYLQLQMSGGDSAIVASGITGVNGSLLFGRDANTGTFTESARFDASGNLLVGTTTAITTGRFVLKAPATTNLGEWRVTTNGYSMIMYNASDTQVGYISINASTTTYNTGSDYRLKENIAPMTGALAKVAQLKPCTYTWKATGEDGQGFIAHELFEVVPDAVSGEKDAVDEKGNPRYQGVDTSFLVATLTAAIQEQQAIITTLTDRITALEAK